MSKENQLPKISFYNNVKEPVVPEIRLTRSKDGKTGQAIFTFEEPQALSVLTTGEINGMSLIDEEGVLSTREVKARFIDGTPRFIDAIYLWRNGTEFERFMRFANRYAKANGLGYSEK
tara:strand:- start:2685 stop:3038 length:354 start_codon:yes stop_codon:yes gene_type:complete